MAAAGEAVKRTGFRPPTPEQVERARERQRESARRWKGKPKFRGAAKLSRKKRIKLRNEKRAARLFERNYHSEAFVAWVHSLACSVSASEGGESDPVVAAHIRSRGAGGDWTAIVPMLQSLHDELHRIGRRSFEERYGVDLEIVAAAVNQRWRGFVA